MARLGSFLPQAWHHSLYATLSLAAEMRLCTCSPVQYAAQRTLLSPAGGTERGISEPEPKYLCFHHLFFFDRHYCLSEHDD